MNKKFDPVLERWEVSRLIPYKNNAKTHPKEQIDALCIRLEKGWDTPIVVEESGVIIKGHGRRLAAMKLGFKYVPVIVRYDLDEDGAKEERIADNRVSEKGKYDNELLMMELGELKDFGVDLDSIGFTDEDIEALESSLMSLNELDIDDMPDDMPDQSNSNSGKEPTEVDYEETLRVVIDCKDEEEQEAVATILDENGYKYKVQGI